MNTIKILLIEDDSDDVELLQEALKLKNIDCVVDVVTEGDKAMPHLENSTPPDVIVMDFNLPKLHGREILTKLRSKGLHNIPIMVLTTSASPDDIKFAFSMGASKFITKPNTMEGFNSTVEAIVSLVQ